MPEPVDEGLLARVLPPQSDCRHAGVGDPWPCQDCWRLIRLEAKLDALIVALRSGAVGKWS